MPLLAVSPPPIPPCIQYIPLTHHPELHVSYPEYVWFPAALANATHSAERLAAEYMGYFNEHPDSAARKAFVTASIEQGLGIHDFSADEVSAW